MKIKKILIISHHFWPENFLINEIALKLKKNLKSQLLRVFQIIPKGKFIKNIKIIFQLKKRILMVLK